MTVKERERTFWSEESVYVNWEGGYSYMGGYTFVKAYLMVLLKMNAFYFR